MNFLKKSPPIKPAPQSHALWFTRPLASRSLFGSKGWIAALLLGAIISTEAMGFVFEITGTLPVQSTASQFTFKTTLKNLLPNEVPANPKAFETYLKVFINGETNPVPTETPPNTDVTPNYIIRYVSDRSSTDIQGTTLELELEILTRNGNPIYTSPTSDSIKVKVNYTNTNTNTNTDSTEITLFRENIVYIEAPGFTKPNSILGSQKSLTVFIDSKSEVNTVDKDNNRKNRASPPVLAFAFPLLDPPLTLELPAKIYDPKTFEHKDTTCTLTTPNGNSGPCLTTCLNENQDKTNVYLNYQAIDQKKLPTLIKAKAGFNPSQVILSGLENEKKYFVFLAYEGGTKASECLVGIPSVNYTLTELNGEAEATVVDMRCFIATAAYGTPLAQEVGLFRWYRDKVLDQSPIGRGIISLYYHISPPLAALVGSSPTLKSLTLPILNHLATRLRLIQQESEPREISLKEGSL